MESLQINHTQLPPCCIALYGENIVIGTYELDKPSGNRTGSLDLYTRNFELLKSVPTAAAILDVKISGDRIYTAHSSGEVKIWTPLFELVDTINLAQLKAVYEGEEAESSEIPLITQIELQNGALAATTTHGEVVVVDLPTQRATYAAQPHSLEAWTVAWDNKDSNDILYTGGDDRQLTCTDLRVPVQLWAVKPHDAGVTSILPRGGGELWTGGYDDTLKRFNNHTRRAADETQLAGGVWRLLPSPDAQHVLACCMYGGLQILSSREFGKVKSELANHESMVYGGAWLNNTTGITCSFYDKMLQKWALN